jgi:hypothetical protein
VFSAYQVNKEKQQKHCYQQISLAKTTNVLLSTNQLNKENKFPISDRSRDPSLSHQDGPQLRHLQLHCPQQVRGLAAHQVR